MENKSEITLSGISPAPGADSETFNRFVNWSTEIYLPLYMTLPGRTGIDIYKIITQNPEYPSFLPILHWKDVKGAEASNTNPERIATDNELTAWKKRRVMVVYGSQGIN